MPSISCAPYGTADHTGATAKTCDPNITFRRGMPCCQSLRPAKDVAITKSRWLDYPPKYQCQAGRSNLERIGSRFCELLQSARSAVKLALTRCIGWGMGMTNL